MDKIALVFSMEKVGSSTVMEAFRSIGRNPERGTANNLDYLITPDRYEAVVTPVRDPVARNISYYFELFGNDWVKATPHMDYILEHMMLKIDHDFPLTWFDLVYTPFMGYDPMKRSFSRTRGWSIYNKRFLLIQTEAMNRAMGEAFDGLFGMRHEMEYRGSSVTSRAYGDLYKKFVDWATFPDSYLERMYSSKYVEHFYTKKQIERMRARWTKK